VCCGGGVEDGGEVGVAVEGGGGDRSGECGGL